MNKTLSHPVLAILLSSIRHLSVLKMMAQKGEGKARHPQLLDRSVPPYSTGAAGIVVFEHEHIKSKINRKSLD